MCIYTHIVYLVSSVNVGNSNNSCHYGYIAHLSGLSGPWNQSLVEQPRPGKTLVMDLPAQKAH